MASAAKVKRKAAQTSLSAVTTTGAGATCDFGIAPVRDVRYYIKAATVTTGGVIKIEASPDNVDWYVFSSVTVSASGNTTALVTSAGAGCGRYWRANLTSRTDGTYTVKLAADSDYN